MKKSASSFEKKVMIFAAAKMYSLGKDQNEVGERLRVSQPKVSQLLKEAKSRQYNYLTLRPTLKCENVEREVIEETERRYFNCAPLQERIQHLAPNHMRDFFSVHVLDCTQFEHFCDQAAQVLYNILSYWPQSLIGLSWGKTLAKIVEKITHHLPATRTVLADRCIPLCGDPVMNIHLGGAAYSASVLAAQLEKALTQDHPSSPSLAAVPAYLPSHLLSASPGRKANPKSAADGSSVESFFRSIPGWAKIFSGGEKDGPPLVDQLDFTISSLGILQEDPKYDGAFLLERLKSERNLTRAELEGLVLGDFCGLLIPRAKSGPSVQRVQALNQGWMGVTPDHFQSIAKRAQNRRRNGICPGNVVITFEPQKAHLLLALILKGWLNHIIISRKLAETLIDDAETMSG